MFKKSLLTVALSIALIQPTVNASTIPVLDIQQTSLSNRGQEILKYENIIKQLKSQLKEKNDFNDILEKKLNDAINLSKSISNEKITEEQANSLNTLILKLNKNVQENKIDNNVLDNKIKVLEQFLENYKNNIVNEKKEIVQKSDETKESIPESAIKAVPLKENDIQKQKDIETAIKETNIPIDYKLSNEIVTKELSAEDAKKQKNIEIALTQKEELKPETQIMKKEISKEEFEKIKLIEEKKDSNLDKNNINATKEVSDKKVSNKQDGPAIIATSEEKTFSEIFMEKLDNLIIWFKKIFGLIDEPTIVKENTVTIVPDKDISNEIKPETLNVDNQKNPEQTSVKDGKNDIIYEKFESQAVEHIITTDKAEFNKDVENKATQPNNEKIEFDKELESFIKEEHEDSNILKKEEVIDNKPIEDKKDGIIIKVNKPGSDINNTSFNEVQNMNKLEDASIALSQVINYKVKKGDNLSKIVKKHYNMKTNKEILEKVKEISRLNNIESKNLIHIGDIIKLS